MNYMLHLLLVMFLIACVRIFKLIVISMVEHKLNSFPICGNNTNFKISYVKFGHWKRAFSRLGRSRQ